MARYRLISSFLAVALLIVFGGEFMVQPAAGTEPNPAIQEDDVQVLDSGPIHEAFAQALVMDPEPGIVTPKEPPPLIDEMPPEQKPEGDAQWIPGYWAWDDERDDYIWVSGIWRV
ncbi:MAG: YXWGXW repeat-containing protein, partial [Deltaproteobacteria bacterium]